MSSSPLPTAWVQAIGLDGVRQACITGLGPGSASGTRKPWETVTGERRENPVPLNLMN